MRFKRNAVRTCFALVLTLGLAVGCLDLRGFAQTAQAAETIGVAVGPQYDTTHVYVAPEDFDRFVAAFKLPNFPYEKSLSNAVRINRTPRVFTANEAPPSVTIFLHHEMAQTPVYPSKLFFFCEKPADAPGVGDSDGPQTIAQRRHTLG